MRNYKAYSTSAVVLFMFLFGVRKAIADDNYDIHSNPNHNQTVRVIWTYQSTDPHYIRCIADGTPNPTLHWTLDLETNEEFTGGNSTTFETTSPQDIKLIFNDISYDIIQDYYCVSSNTTDKKLLTFTYFKVLVQAPMSKMTVFGALVLLIIFLVAAFIIMRVFKINEGSTKIDL